MGYHQKKFLFSKWASFVSMDHTLFRRSLLVVMMVLVYSCIWLSWWRTGTSKFCFPSPVLAKFGEHPGNRKLRSPTLSFKSWCTSGLPTRRKLLGTTPAAQTWLQKSWRTSGFPNLGSLGCPPVHPPSCKI